MSGSDRKPEVICFANFKGGVGKSTSAVNVAVGLARAGRRTLLADCDPQANASEMFMPEPEIKTDFRSIIAERVPTRDVVKPTRIGGLDVLPASFDLAYLDKELVVTPDGVQRIKRALRPVAADYDFIVIDTGPNLSHLTLGALVASRHIIIPVSATVWSTTGLRKFMGWIGQHQRDEVVDAGLLGIVATIVPARTRIGRGVLDEIKASPYPAFATYIPRKIAAEDAVVEGAVMGEPAADPDLSDAYRRLTEEVITRVATAADREART